MGSIYLPYQKPPRWNISRAEVAYNCAQMGLPMPVLAMPMWGGGNTVYDYSGNQHHGTLENSPYWVPGGVKFIGSDSRISLNSFVSQIDLNKSWTIIVVWSRSSGPSYEALFTLSKAASSNGFLYFVVNGGGVYCESKNDAGIQTWLINQVGNNYDDGKQHIAVLTKQSNNRVDLYVDGVWLSEDNSITSGTYTPDLAQFGIYRNTVGDFQGTIFAGSVFPEYFSASQVQTICNNPFGMFEPIRGSLWIVPAAATTATPTTAAPTTLAPTSLAPTSLAPTTATPADIRSAQVLAQVEWVESVPTTAGPTTAAPTTAAPTTVPIATTPAPTTSAPTTAAPTTPSPTTAVPTTSAPTAAPSTAPPTTLAPTTPVPPTTLAPTTVAPPTTLAPTTPTLTTLAPTTAPPETICIKELNSTIIKELSLGSLITKEIRSNGHLC